MFIANVEHVQIPVAFGITVAVVTLDGGLVRGILCECSSLACAPQDQLEAPVASSQSACIVLIG